MQIIERDKDAPENPRATFVQKMLGVVEDDLKHWEPDFTRMKRNRAYARGLQWPGMTMKSLSDPERPYVENVTLRHLKQRVSAIYARNPQFVWRRSKRLYSKVWDGTAAQLALAQQTLMSPGALPEQMAIAQMILQEAATYAQQSQVIERAGETLALLYTHSLREQTQPVKHMMKRMVMTAATCGVGYVKQTFQRQMQSSPEVERQINDVKSQLDTVTRLMQDVAEGEVQPDDAEVDRLRVLLTQLENVPQVLVREGLALDYPDPLNIIPSREMTYLPTFLGCSHVTERYFLTPERVKEVYGVDLGSKYRPYRRMEDRTMGSGSAPGECKDAQVAIFEMYHKADGVVYVMADGYPDFLREPEEPFPWTERFWPWFAFAPNWTADPEHPFAPSDVELTEPMQAEINRSGEGRRDHRYAARPGHVVAGSLDEGDGQKMKNRRSHDILPLKGMPPDGDVRKWLQAFPVSPYDPNLYETGQAMQGLLRVAGTAESSLGPTSNATATEASIAQASRSTSDDSSIDELDDLLSEMARYGGQILLQNVTAETVAKVVGPAAVWPEASREEISQEVFLEVEAGSSGRKNQAHDIQTWTQMFPLMAQIPGYKPERLARHLLSVIDPRLMPEDWIETGLPSITALNGQMQAAANAGTPAGLPPARDPTAQGPAGASNAPQQEPGGAPGPQAPPPPMMPPG